jgi:hypothetical protein
MTIMRNGMYVVMALCTLAVLSFAYAQPPEPSERPAWQRAGREAHGMDLPEEWRERDVKELVETLWMVRLTKELGLSDEQTVLMVRRTNEFKDQKKELGEKRQQLVRALKADIKSGQPEEQVRQKLDELIAHDKKVPELKWQMYEKVAEGLSVAQRAKLYVFMNEFEGEMRHLIEKARQRMGGYMQPPAGEPGTPGGPMSPDIHRPARPEAPVAPGQRPGPRGFQPGMSPGGGAGMQPGAPPMPGPPPGPPPGPAGIEPMAPPPPVAEP